MTALAISLLSLGACATLTRSEHATWTVNSSPQGAGVTTSSGYQCPTTPCSLLVRRNHNFSATLTLPGYQPETVQVTPTLGPQGGIALFGNAIIGGVIGAGIDFYTGAALDPSPNGRTFGFWDVTGAGTSTAPGVEKSTGLPFGCTVDPFRM